MKLSPRLKAVVSLLELSGVVADIGTDHAYVPIYLIRETTCSQVIASEYTELPYQKAVNQVEEAGVKNKIEVRQGFGLSVVDKEEIAEVVIAGLGGFTIREIISSQFSLVQTVDRLVLQPMSGIKELRAWLAANELQIIEEKLAKEGNKFYHVLAVEAGEMELKDPFLQEVGPKIIENKDPLLEEFLSQQKKKWQQIKSQLKIHRPESKRLNHLQQKLDRLQEVKKWL